MCSWPFLLVPHQIVQKLESCLLSALIFFFYFVLFIFLFIYFFFCFAATDEVKLLRFPCKHCNMKFAQIRGLKVHIRHNHLKLSM